MFNGHRLTAHVQRTPAHPVNIFSTLYDHSTAAFSRLPSIEPRATPIDLRKLMRDPQLFGGGLLPRGARCQRKSKWTARYFNILIHHNSFWNRNSGHWFSMCGLVFSIAASCTEGLRSEAVFCFSCISYLAGYCCFSSCCHSCSES